MTEAVTLDSLKGARRWAMAVDLAAIAASTAANITHALTADVAPGDERSAVGAVLVAMVPPLGLAIAVGIWHRSQGILTGRLAQAFSALLAGVAAGAAYVSFGHIQSVAQHFGQSETDAVIIALVIDLTAVLATVVLIGAGQKMTELTEAAEAARAAERQAARDAEVAEAAARAEAAKAKAAEATEAAARAERMAARTSTVAPKLASVPAVAPARGEATELAIADYLATHPDAKQSAVAKAVGCSAKTVQRSTAWADHKASKAVAS
jgi:hypothetical protein